VLVTPTRTVAEQITAPQMKKSHRRPRPARKEQVQDGDAPAGAAGLVSARTCSRRAGLMWIRHARARRWQRWQVGATLSAAWAHAQYKRGGLTEIFCCVGVGIDIGASRRAATSAASSAVAVFASLRLRCGARFEVARTQALAGCRQPAATLTSGAIQHSETPRCVRKGASARGARKASRRRA
jgi:hypothetical protein